MFHCWRKDEAVNPEIYAAAVAAVLAEYSDDIVEYVTDPRTGLPSKHQWHPTIKEVREACDEINQAIASASKRERDLAQQLADRAQWEAELAQRCQSADQIKQKFSFLDKYRSTKMNAQILDGEAVRKQLGISKEQWDAIPNLPADVRAEAK